MTIEVAAFGLWTIGIGAAIVALLLTLNKGNSCAYKQTIREITKMFNRGKQLALATSVAIMSLRGLFDSAYQNHSPSFAMRYGNNPQPLNGSRNGQLRKSGVAAAKRSQAKRRNVAKHPRTAHKGRSHGR